MAATGGLRLCRRTAHRSAIIGELYVGSVLLSFVEDRSPSVARPPNNALAMREPSEASIPPEAGDSRCLRVRE